MNQPTVVDTSAPALDQLATYLRPHAGDRADRIARWILARHTRELADMQRAMMRTDGYDLDCVCGACSACLAGEYVDQLDEHANALTAAVSGSVAARAQDGAS